MDITKKVAYLKGLFDGYSLEEDNKETNLIRGIIDVLEELAVAVEDTVSTVDELSDFVDELDEDLADLEDYLDYEDDDCDCCCDDDEDDDEDCCCGHGHHHHHGDSPIYEVTCPKCGDVVYLDEEILLEGNTVCPGCETVLEFDISDGDEDEDEDEE